MQLRDPSSLYERQPGDSDPGIPSLLDQPVDQTGMFGAFGDGAAPLFNYQPETEIPELQTSLAQPLAAEEALQTATPIEPKSDAASMVANTLIAEHESKSATPQQGTESGPEKSDDSEYGKAPKIKSIRKSRKTEYTDVSKPRKTHKRSKLDKERVSELTFEDLPSLDWKYSQADILKAFEKAGNFESNNGESKAQAMNTASTEQSAQNAVLFSQSAIDLYLGVSATTLKLAEQKLPANMSQEQQNKPVILHYLETCQDQLLRNDVIQLLNTVETLAHAKIDELQNFLATPLVSLQYAEMNVAMFNNMSGQSEDQFYLKNLYSYLTNFYDAIVTFAAHLKQGKLVIKNPNQDFIQFCMENAVNSPLKDLMNRVIKNYDEIVKMTRLQIDQLKQDATLIQTHNDLCRLSN